MAGLTLLELIIATSILVILASAAMPLARVTVMRSRESELHYDLRQMRDAIDRYKDAADRGLIQVAQDSFGYPPDLETLVEGVTLSTSGDKKIRFLRKIPTDPMTGKAEWALVEAPEGGFMGVHSLSEETPIKSGDFSAKDAAFADAENYTKWTFTYSPTGLGTSIVPGAKR